MVTRKNARDQLRNVLPNCGMEANLACAHVPLQIMQQWSDCATRACSASGQDREIELLQIEHGLRQLAQAVTGNREGPEGMTSHTFDNCEDCRALAECDERLLREHKTDGF